MKIPKGWRKLRNGVFIKTGDKMACFDGDKFKFSIYTTKDRAKTWGTWTYIRKIK